MRALVKGTALEKPQPMTRQVKASDGFIDELPWFRKHDGQQGSVVRKSPAVPGK